MILLLIYWQHIISRVWCVWQKCNSQAVAVVVVIVCMAIPEQPGAGEIDQEAGGGNYHLLVLVDRAWGDQAHDRVEEREAGAADEQDRVGVAAEYFDFPGPESEAAIVGKTPGSAVSQG